MCKSISKNNAPIKAVPATGKYECNFYVIIPVFYSRKKLLLKEDIKLNIKFFDKAFKGETYIAKPQTFLNATIE